MTLEILDFHARQMALFWELDHMDPVFVYASCERKMQIWHWMKSILYKFFILSGEPSVAISPSNAVYINHDMNNVTCNVEIANSADMVFLKITAGANNDTSYHTVPDSFLIERENKICSKMVDVNFRGNDDLFCLKAFFINHNC